MKKEDIKLLLEIKANCLKDYGTITGTYSDTKRLLKANAISNALNEIERLTKELEFERQIKKEAREYIEPFVAFDNDIMVKGRMLKPVLEILDKVGANK